MRKKGGPKTKPFAIIKLHGSNHLYRRKLKDLEVPKGIPEMPESLTGEAKAEWERITSVLGPLGILAPIDRGLLIGCCEFWADYVEARQYCKVPLVKTKEGNVIQNPAIGIKNRAFQLYCRAAAELGISPSARAGRSSAKLETQDKAKEFFRSISS